jgi:hypothetical protein
VIFAGVVTKAARVRFETLQPAVAFFARPDLLTAHRPSAVVVHVALVPSFQKPVTATPATM